MYARLGPQLWMLKKTEYGDILSDNTKQSELSEGNIDEP
jgi:hypothetical protein